MGRCREMCCCPLADDCRLADARERRLYAPRTTEHVSLHGPTAASVTELLQLPAPDYMEQFTITSQRCRLIVGLQSVLATPALTTKTFLFGG